MLLLLVAACGGDSSGGATVRPEPADGVVLRWAVSQGLWGEELLEVKADGEVTYGFEPADPNEAAVDGSFELTPDQLAQLRRTLDEHDACDIESGRDGIPDEGRPSLTLSWASLECRVTAWDGEWDDDAPEILRAINDLRRRASEAD